MTGMQNSWRNQDKQQMYMRMLFQQQASCRPLRQYSDEWLPGANVATTDLIQLRCCTFGPVFDGPEPHIGTMII